ncbi:MAG: hypothetical protein GY795_43675 [Desulfobacterales bacterium]|nr:hypothetical protein [Desulfobacterales bacterium]
MSDAKYDFSGSDFRGAIMNFESTVTQYISGNPNIDQSEKDELEELIKQLSSVLQEAPSDKSDETETITETAKQLVEVATKEKPNKSMVQISASGLKQAAESIADVVPKVLGVVTQIIQFVYKIIG